MDSIDWSEIHHFEAALYSPLLKGIKQKKRYPYHINFDVTLVDRPGTAWGKCQEE